MVRSLQGQAGLMMGKNLKLDLVGGVGQELGCFCERTVLHAGPVDGQDVIAHVQSTTSTGKEKVSLRWSAVLLGFRLSRPHS